jgi:NAD+ kinase
LAGDVLVGVVGYPRYRQLGSVLARLQACVRARGWALVAEPELACRGEGIPVLESQMLSHLAVLVTLGGDGTLLRGVRLLHGANVPVLGVNMGRVGFLTSVGPDQMETAFSAFAAGETVFDERMMLQAQIESGDREIEASYLAVNEVVLHRGGVARLVRLELSAHGEAVGSYSADGIILSTPTGSTAYSLSAGGPIVAPMLDCIVATPISAHTMSIRPLVLSAAETVAVEVLSPSPELMLTVDGQDTAQLTLRDRVVVSRARSPLRLVRMPGHTFFATLHRKLKWGDLDERQRRPGSRQDAPPPP